MPSNTNSDAGAIYVQWSDDGQHIRKWSRGPFEGAVMFSRTTALTSDGRDAGGVSEKAVMVCPQCEGEGGYPDGLDDAACHTDCTRCAGNGWIVDLAALAQPVEAGEDGLAKHTFVTCVSGDGPTPYLKVHFNTLADAHAAHDQFLGTSRGAK